MSPKRVSRAEGLVYASVIGPVGCQEIALDVWCPVSGRAVIIATLSRTAPDLRTWDAGSADDLVQVGRPDRMWTWEGNVVEGYSSIVPEWLLVGLTPGKYLLHLSLGDGRKTFCKNESLIQVEGVLLDVSGPPLVMTNSAHTVTVVLRPVLSRAVEGASVQLTDMFGRVIVPQTAEILRGEGETPSASARDLVLLPGRTVEARFEVRSACPGSQAIVITVYDDNRRRIGRGVYRYHAIQRGVNGQVSADWPHGAVENVPVPEWAYRATISKIYNPVDPSVVPTVIAETRAHGVSVFSWETHRPEHFELFPLMTEEANRQGLHTLAYTGAVGLEGDEFLQRYPDCTEWVVRNSENRMHREWGALPFAPASPYFSHYRAPFFRYLARELDGVFADISNLYRDTDYSPYSMDSFSKWRKGDAAEPSAWNEWRYDTVAELAERVRSEVKAVSPTAVLSWNMAESIGRLTWSRDYALDIVRLGRIIDVPLVECNYVEGEPLWILGANARYYAGAAPGKPVWVALRFTYPDGATFTPAQVEATMAEIYANGACAYIDWQPVAETLQRDRDWLAVVDRMFNFVRANEDFFVDRRTRSAARVALVYSRTTNDYWNNPGQASANAAYQGEFLGWYLALLECGVQADVIAHERLREAEALLQEYDALLLPAVATLTADEAAAVVRYAEEGGRVLTTWRTGGGDFPGDAARAGTETGKGTIVHVPEAAGRAYWESRDERARQVIQHALGASGLGDCGVVRIHEQHGNVPMIEAVAYHRGADTLLVHLVNWNTNLGDWYAASHAYQDGKRAFVPITEIRPVKDLDLSVRVPVGREVEQVEWVTVGSDVADVVCTQESDGSVRVSVPVLTSLGVLKMRLGQKRCAG